MWFLYCSSSLKLNRMECNFKIWLIQCDCVDWAIQSLHFDSGGFTNVIISLKKHIKCYSILFFFIHMRRNVIILWCYMGWMFICSEVMSYRMVFWVFTTFADAILVARACERKKKDVNGQIFVYNFTCYDDGIHVCFICSCVMYNCKALLIWGGGGFCFFKLDFLIRWQTSHFDPESIMNIEDRTIFHFIISLQTRALPNCVPFKHDKSSSPTM